MPTEKPRVTFTVSQETLAEIDEYRFSTKSKNQTQAILSLIEVGLSVYAAMARESFSNLSENAQTVIDAEIKKSTSGKDVEGDDIKELKSIYNSLNETGKQQLMIQARQIANFDEYIAAPQQYKHA